LQTKIPTFANQKWLAPESKYDILVPNRKGYKEERRLLTMTEVHNLRKLYYNEDKNITEIAKQTGRDRKTVRQSLHKDGCNRKGFEIN